MQVRKRHRSLHRRKWVAVNGWSFNFGLNYPFNGASGDESALNNGCFLVKPKYPQLKLPPIMYGCQFCLDRGPVFFVVFKADTRSASCPAHPRTSSFSRTGRRRSGCGDKEQPQGRTFDRRGHCAPTMVCGLIYISLNQLHDWHFLWRISQSATRRPSPSRAVHILNHQSNAGENLFQGNHCLRR